MRKLLRSCVIISGLACMVASGVFFWNTHQEETLAMNMSAQVTKEFCQTIENQAHQVPLANVDDVTLETQSAQEDGQSTQNLAIADRDYMAVLSFPQLDLELPVASTCNYDNLSNTPCVYSGTIAENDLIIAAHNYQAHFGKIGELANGEEITLLDVAGVLRTYQVTGQEIIDGNNLEGLLAGDWDLTLFTCLYGNNTQRVVLRLDAVI